MVTRTQTQNFFNGNSSFGPMKLLDEQEERERLDGAFSVGEGRGSQGSLEANPEENTHEPLRVEGNIYVEIQGNRESKETFSIASPL